MTKQEYQDAGFRLSLQVEQVDIDRAEREVTEAYCKPIAPDMDTTQEEYRKAVMNLAFLWILQHSIFGTRSGAKGCNAYERGYIERVCVGLSLWFAKPQIACKHTWRCSRY